MVRNIIAIVIGALVSFGLLILFDGGTRIITDRNTAYVVALALGGLANFFWPVILGWRAARRVRDRRNADIQSEVDRQISQQQRQ